MMPRMLIADDQPDLLDALKLLLKGQGIEVDAVTSPEAALARSNAQPFDLVLMDLNYTGDTTSGREGIDLLSRVQALDRLLPVIVMTGWGSVDLAVEAMRRGVRDFVQKPWDNAHLLATLRARNRGGRARRRQSTPPSGASSPRRCASRRACCRSRSRKSTDGSSPSRGSRPPASAAIASTPSASATRASRSRSPTSSARAFPAALLMSQSAGRRARVRVGSGRAAGALPPGESDPLRQHRRRALHQLLLLPCSTRPTGVAHLHQRRPLPADARARRRLGRAARRSAGPCSACFPRPSTNRRASRSARAIGWCSSPTA